MTPEERADIVVGMCVLGEPGTEVRLKRKIAIAIREAVKEESEACAGLALDSGEFGVAEAIRARKAGMK